MAKRRNVIKRRKIFQTAIKVFLGLVAVFALAVLVTLVIKWIKEATSVNVMYLGGTSASADVYYYDEYERRLFKADDGITRGAKVTVTDQTYYENGKTYTVIKYGSKTYYVNQDCLVESADDVIQETEKWVRTSVTVYENYEGPEIASFIKKGTKINVTGYDELLSDGSINMYEVEYEGITGWVFGKYLVDTQAEAEAYNEEYYQKHQSRTYGSDLYGGTAESLDWYPFEKPEFKNNTMIEDARAMYLCLNAFNDIDSYIELAKENGVNTIVMDIKDVKLACEYETVDEWSPSMSTMFVYSESFVSQVAQKIKDAGFYLICRIVVFNDTYYGLDHPESCIDSDSASQIWPSAFCRDVWEYNVTLALEVIEKYGPNEIQFDYVRFPAESLSMSKDPSTDFKNTYGEEKCEAIQNFLIYACDQIHQKEVYVSADVFAECAGEYISAYGQYFPAISNVVDAISAMPYTDHYGESTDTWTDAYTTVNNWANKAAQRQKEIPTPAVVRTWLTCYNVPWWNPTSQCNVAYFSQEALALYDAGLTGGFLTWNAVSSLKVYNKMAEAWGLDYGYGTGGTLEDKHKAEVAVNHDWPGKYPEGEGGDDS